MKKWILNKEIVKILRKYSVFTDESAESVRSGYSFKKSSGIISIIAWFTINWYFSGNFSYKFFLKKCCFLLYVLNSLSKLLIRPYIADYKVSGDLTADLGDSVALIDKFYYKFLEIKTSRTNEHILLIVDEYAGMPVWLEGNDKNQAEGETNFTVVI